MWVHCWSLNTFFLVMFVVWNKCDFIFRLKLIHGQFHRLSNSCRQKLLLPMYYIWVTAVQQNRIWCALPWIFSRHWLRVLILKGATSCLTQLQTSCDIQTTTRICSPLLFSTCLIKQLRCRIWIFQFSTILVPLGLEKLTAGSLSHAGNHSGADNKSVGRTANG